MFDEAKSSNLATNLEERFSYMTIAPYILNHLPPLALEDSLAQALDLPTDVAPSHRAVVSQGVWQGNMSMADVEELSPATQVQELRMDLENFHLSPNANLMEAVKAFQSYEANYIPVVLPENGHFVGYILQEDIFNALCEMPLFSEEGIWINLRVPTQDFSLSEITQITEVNNAKLYAAFVSHLGEESVEIALKIKPERLSEVVAAYERYGYMVSYEAGASERADEMRERYNQLIRFLNV
ncbi:CBS domain-containing protein [Ornithobacterium rhinotracheale]|uniref:CBS domain-containing protein n=1 Tax=Ornithobacterium rhinotracheale TaxID=28251 RepID=A0A410JU77_ORNRH|nr:CBS domain-containing protein [Ornithobacterium rhinotracheale]QAR31588.1 CBS domain-containing protein [Ornithobacterium rhinotracheale]